MKVSKAVVYGESIAAYAELCGGGAELADEVVALVVGTQADADAVAGYGVAVRLIERDESLLLDDYFAVLAGLVAEEAPQLVLLRPSRLARALAGRLAVATGLPVASDVAALSVGSGGIEYRVVRYGGATEQSATVQSVIALAGQGVFAPAEPAAGGSVTIVGAAVEAGPVKLVSRAPRGGETVDLNAADVVVGVGRGIGSEENVAAATKLAQSLGGDVACTRPVAEGLEWLPKSRYLGVTGAVIAPKVYLALGISGQVQHMVGVEGAKTIIAVNKDKAAPIFAKCDLGLVADVDQVLPGLAELG